jgi:hypothetical protein
MHRLIDKTPTEFKIDHINGNRLDNRKINIRRCTVKQNSQNRNTTSQNQSGIKGVTFCNDHQRKKPWAAKIENNGRTKFLGYYSTKEEAGVAYNAEAKKLFGDFAYLNTC